jgi:RNA polymerase sigma-70 factor, ECF subfamily
MLDTDAELIAAARTGDRAAIERLLERHHAEVYRFGRKMCGEDEDAKDVLQETLLAAARSLPEFRGASAFSTWLYTIARSFCVKKRHRSKFAPAELESLDPHAAHADVRHPGRNPEEDAAGRQLRVALDAAIADLDVAHREVLVLRDVEGLTATEVAEVMGLTVEAVKSRLHRARLAVRERLSPLLEAPEPSAAGAGGCRDVVEAFSRRLEGEIDGLACAELEGHLQGCARCRSRCDSMRETLALCKRSGAQVVPTAVAQSVRTAVREFLQTER